MLRLMLILLGAFVAAQSARAADSGDADTIAYFKQVNAQASKGDTNAQICLGLLYGTGIGTELDVSKAQSWYQAATDKGNLRGKQMIARMYLWGFHVPPDPAKAMRMLNELVAAGYMPAATDIGYAYGHGDGVSKDAAKAVEWYRKGAAADDYWAEAYLALAYLNGDGVKGDSSIAQTWLHKAASHKIDCYSEYGIFFPRIIEAYLKGLPDLAIGLLRGPLIVAFTEHDRRAEYAFVYKSSDVAELDNAWMDATRRAVLPPWPSSLVSHKIAFQAPELGGALNPEFIQSTYSAIKSALVFPKKIFLYGSKGIGVATVSFDYLNGKVANAKITLSSADKDADASALDAINHADYPPTPAEYKDRTLHLAININFNIDIQASPTPSTNGPAATTKSAPAAATTNP